MFCFILVELCTLVVDLYMDVFYSHASRGRCDSEHYRE